MRPMTDWELIDALTDDVSWFGFTYREAWEWLQDLKADHSAITVVKIQPEAYVCGQPVDRKI